MIQHITIPVGTFDRGRVEFNLALYEKYGLIKNSVPLDEYIFEPIAQERKSFLSKEESSYLKNKKVIKMCIDPDWMPLEKNDKGKHIGMSADYIALMQEYIGIPIEMVDAKSWAESLQYGKERKCDIFSLVMSTKERESYLDFTKPYLKTPFVLVTNLEELFVSDFSKIADKKIGIVKDYAYAEIIKEKYPNIELVEVPNMTIGLEMVLKGELYGFIDTLATAGYQVQKNYLGQLKITGKFDDTWNLGIATRNDEPILKNIFDKAIDLIPSSQKDEILNRWTSVNYTKDVSYRVLLQWIISVIVLFSVILIVIVFVNRRLRVEIKNRKVTEKRLQKYIELVDENIIISSTDLDGKITDASSAFCAVSGYTKEELIGNTHSMFKAMEKSVYENIWQTLLQNKSYSGEIKNSTKDGSYYWANAYITPIYNEKNEKIGYTAIREDITSKKRLEEISITDELTTLYNRRHFNEMFPKLINSAKRENKMICFAILDLDYFKQYNDTYGHLAGDEVLKRVSAAMKSSVNRADDYCFRLGGEEFGILFKGLDIEGATLLINSVKNNIENLHIEHQQNSASKYVTASFGLVVKDARYVAGSESLYKEADELLYRAKAQGRNKVVASI